MTLNDCDREHVDPALGNFCALSFFIAYCLLFFISLLWGAWSVLSWIIDVFRYGF